MGFWRIVFTIILPPLGVLLGKGFGWAFILNIILTLLGYIPSRPDPRLLGADPRLRAGPANQTSPRDPLRGESGSLYTAAGYPSTSSGESPRPGRRST